MDLSGKHAVVTGGSMGIGNAICLALARCGADVALNYRKHATEAEAVAEQVRAAGAKALAIQADVASFKDAQLMVDRVTKEWGQVDILVCNAGVNWDGMIWKMTEEQWDAVIATNLKGYFNYIRAVAPQMKERQSGKIVTITSINGKRGKLGQANYAASKAGIIGLTKTCARDLGKFSVNVNAVAPGLIETDMMAQAPQAVKDLALSEILLGRLGKPEEVAQVVCFLASELARHVTGQVLNVDGGQFLG
ncbi:MAG: SDR family oxidoreductase [Deltaproteobacteria bacterium]|nr:SDR family oxidoreductase [Deltaproteobacteria bacterium]